MLSGIKFGVEVRECKEKECIFRFDGCKIEYCPLPLKLNPFCRAKDRRQCRNLFKVVEHKGRKYIIYYCDGRRCPFFSTSIFSNKILKQFGKHYLTRHEIEKMFADRKEELENNEIKHRISPLVDFVVNELFTKEDAERIYRLITEEG